MSPEYLFYTLIDEIEADDAEWVQRKIDLGADVHRCLVCGETALHKAARRSTAEVVRILMAAGADIHAEMDWGATPLTQAAGRVPSASSTAITQMLIAAGSDLEQRSNGYTALHAAVYARNLETASLLIAAGAAVDAVSDKGETPLVMALAPNPRVERFGKGCHAMCDLLARAGANSSFVPEGAASRYLTPFQSTMFYGQLETFKMLAEVCGEDPGQRTLDGRPLMKLFPPSSAAEKQQMKQLLRALKTEREVKQAIAVERDNNERVTARRARGFSPL